MIIIIFLIILAVIAFTQTRILYQLESVNKLKKDVEDNKMITEVLYMEVCKQGRKST